MIAHMIGNKKLSPIVTELIIRGRKLNISTAFTILFSCTKAVRLNYTHFFIVKIPNKREFQQIAFNHPSNFDFENFMNLQKMYWKAIFFFSD